MNSQSILVVGAGVFGTTAAVELVRRGCRVTLLDPGPIPHPMASSTDISKAVRMDYGSDTLYTTMAEGAIAGWRTWNQQSQETLFHEDGFLFLTTEEMRPGLYEFESYNLLLRRGHHPERISPKTLPSRYPAWNPERYRDGYLSPKAGWAESGNVVRWLAKVAQAGGVVLRDGAKMRRLLEDGSRVTGVVLEDGETLHADIVVVAGGPWSPVLVPELRQFMRPVAQPIFYFQPADVRPYMPERFPVWSSDLSKAGWYGFPVNSDGVVKVSNHGVGREMHPDEPHLATADDERRCRVFLAEALPDLAAAPLINMRTCLYCDSWDGNFYIDHVPDRSGLVVATGGSGHGFKFAPVLGSLIADAVERKSNPFGARFTWRQAGKPTKEQARGGTT